jgi:hypothetical protein
VLLATSDRKAYSSKIKKYMELGVLLSMCKVLGSTIELLAHEAKKYRVRPAFFLSLFILSIY